MIDNLEAAPQPIANVQPPFFNHSNPHKFNNLTPSIMCNTTQQQQATPSGDVLKELTALDVAYKEAETRMKIAELQSTMDYNRSLAGQMQRQFETYQRIAKPLSESNFVPAAYKGNIGDCVIAVEIACRLQILPLTVMQNLCVVKGNPTWKAKFLIGCVNTCGRYTTLDYRFTIEGKVGEVSYKTWEKGPDGKNREVLKPFDHPELDNVVCVAYATEKSTGRELVSPPVSIRMAVGEGWYTKDGSKWPTMSQLMLRYRAASYWVSSYAPEMAMGFRTTEEAQDIVDVDYEEVYDSLPAPKPKPTTASMENAKEKLRNRSSKKTATDEPANQQPSIDMP